MTKEDKELLLKDLCARLCYKPTVLLSGKEHCTLCGIDGDKVYLNIDSDSFNVESIKPYLRPMSSMTEEECDKVEEIIGNDCIFDFMSNGDIVLHKGHFTQKTLSALYDFYNSIHVDCNTDDQGKTMIEKGLAIEAPEGMYK